MEVKNKGSTDKGATWEPIAVDADGILKSPGGLLNKVIATVEDDKTMEKPGGGSTTLDSSAVPAGKMWVITAISAHNLDADMTRLELGRLTDETNYRLKLKKDPIQYDGIDWQGSVVLKAGDKIRSIHTGGAAGNNIWLYIIGYEITPP